MPTATTTKSPAKKTTSTKAAQPKAAVQATLRPVPAAVLAECLAVAPGKSVLIDLATGGVVQAAKPARKQGAATLSGNMLATLQTLANASSPLTHNAIAAATGREKGNKLRELTGLGMVTTSEQEGARGYVYSLTAKGKAALADAK